MKRYFIVICNNIVNDIKSDYLNLIKWHNTNSKINESKYG